MPEAKVIKLKVNPDVKRFYLGVSITQKCPKCGGECTFAGEEDYLSYPKTGVPEDLMFYCEPCEDNFVVPIQLDMTLTILGPPRSCS